MLGRTWRVTQAGLENRDVAILGSIKPGAGFCKGGEHQTRCRLLQRRGTSNQMPAFAKGREHQKNRHRPFGREHIYGEKQVLMNTISLGFGTTLSETSVSNIFIDYYMADSNGAYVKVYLYLLRCLEDRTCDITIGGIADKLSEAESDVIRAMDYWESRGILAISRGNDGSICDIRILEPAVPAARQASIRLSRVKAVSLVQRSKNVNSEKRSGRAKSSAVPADATGENPGKSSAKRQTKTCASEVKAETPAKSICTEKPDYAPAQIKLFMQIPEFKGMIDCVEEMQGRPLSPKDLQTPAYLYEGLGLDIRTILDIYKLASSGEDSVSSAEGSSRGRMKGSSFIEKTAVEWKKEGISSIEQYNEKKVKNEILIAVRAGFSLGRQLKPAEMLQVRRWSESGMSPELIAEACERALKFTGDVSFGYANGIIENWQRGGISDMEGVKAADREFGIKKKAGREAANVGADPTKVVTYNSFRQRKYSDEEFDEMEKRLLGRR